jgi:hypothetical protein
VSVFDEFGSVDGYLSCLVAILYFSTVYALEKLRSGVLVRPWARGLLADYAYPVSTSQAPQSGTISDGPHCSSAPSFGWASFTSPEH